MGFRVPLVISKVITILQILQMVVGCVINYVAYHVKQQRPCAISDENIQYSFIIYLTYFILFGHFFIRAYIKGNAGANDRKDYPPLINGKKGILSAHDGNMSFLKSSAMLNKLAHLGNDDKKNTDHLKHQ
ncbi:hypothetical protein ACOME3_009639 [Neoechinorhynchus agilis]